MLCMIEIMKSLVQRMQRVMLDVRGLIDSCKDLCDRYEHSLFQCNVSKAISDSFRLFRPHCIDDCPFRHHFNLAR